jgi:hypothetical protein
VRKCRADLGPALLRLAFSLVLFDGKDVEVGGQRRRCSRQWRLDLPILVGQVLLYTGVAEQSRIGAGNLGSQVWSCVRPLMSYAVGSFAEIHGELQWSPGAQYFACGRGKV